MSGSQVPNYGSYGGCNIFDYPSPQMSYEIPMHADQQTTQFMDQLEEIKQHTCGILITTLKTIQARFLGEIILQIKIEMYLMYLNQ